MISPDRRRVLQFVPVLFGLLSGCVSRLNNVAGDSKTTTTTQRSGFEIVDREFEVISVDSSVGTDSATVSTSRNTVSVDGTVQASNDCYTAEITEVVTKPAIDFLRIEIETVRRDDATDCSNDNVGIQYRAKLEFADRTPGHVAVMHNGEQANSGSEVDQMAGSHFDPR
jgi:hypothetical protein